MSTALYRRYRPETFTDVIGQQHVTEPLMAALAADRITHAYLFSGPRGCGKTTSARILARCLNCAEGPTDTPCGQCDSCVDLARGGPGSLDVVEIDAASHNGVDDARELRERAAFAPARDRFKIFILDEAHMVTTQGFNALLKLVEEPPPHIKFVFATTEPDKVIGTIRSRTHHYPFRLVAPEKLTDYLQSLAQAEGMNVAGGVLPLVVRAGGGSVRDSLSVLDQLIAGSADGELTYERAVALLGFTHSALLDDAVDALSARDGLSLFRVVDRVIESGHAPRRFVEDLLERLRDLIVVRAAGEESASVLRSVPADQLERMRAQAQHMGAAALSRAADLVNEGLTEMTGATSPRLQLELLCARLLLPAADDGVDGFAARLDRVEAALAGAPAPSAPARAEAPARAGAPARPVPVDPPAPVNPSRVEAPSRPVPAEPAAAVAPDTAPEPADGLSDGPATAGAAARATPQESPGTAGQSPQESGASVASPAPSQDTTRPSDEAGPMTTDQIRRRWPEVLETLARLKRTTWALVSQDAQVMDLSGTTLALGFSTSGLATAFRSGPHAEVVSQALQETLGVDARIEPVLNDGSTATTTTPTATTPTAPAPTATAPTTAATAPTTAPVSPPPADPASPPPADRSEDLPVPGSEPGSTPGSSRSGAGAPVPEPHVQDPNAPASTPDAPGEASAPPVPAAPSGPTPPAGSAPAAGSGTDARLAKQPSHTAPAPTRRPGTDASRAPQPDAAPSGGNGWADIPVRRPPQDPAPGQARHTASSAPPGVSPPAVPGAPSTHQPAPTAQTPGTHATAAPSSSRGDHSADSSAPARSGAAAAAEALVDEPPGSQDPPAPVRRLGDELDEHSPDDPDLESTEVVGAPLVARLLGGTVIDEEFDDPGQVT